MTAKKPAAKKPAARKPAAKKPVAKPAAAAKSAPREAGVALPVAGRSASKPAAAPVRRPATAPPIAARKVRAAAASTVWPAGGPGAAAAAAQRWSLVTAKDIMRVDVVTVSYAAPLSEVERVLADHRISGAPVVDETGQIIGVVSVKDLVERYAEDEDARPRRGHGFFHLSSEETLEEDFDSFEVPQEAEETARDVMTATVYTVPAGAGLREIAGAMCKHKVHRVLVEEDGRLLGLISTLDILEALRV